jgi:hypothetical protein
MQQPPLFTHGENMNEAVVVGLIVAGLTGILGLGVAWKKFSGDPEPRKISPSPLVVTEAPRYMLQGDCANRCDALAKRIDDVERRNNEDMRLIREELSKLGRGTENVQRRVNGMATTVYMIAGKMGLFPQIPEEMEG